jgi:hypothetical protein
MDESSPKIEAVLRLKAGQLVEVRSESEILSTLDEKGNLEGLPFMPEMLACCGRQFRVYRRADKTCDTINNSGSRRMRNTVHLDDLRCDGSAHDGCQARCLIFWKESWLKRVEAGQQASTPAEKPTGIARGSNAASGGNGTVTREALIRATQPAARQEEGKGTIYSCQATELLRASAPLPWWDARQYVRDYRCGTAGISDIVRMMFLWTFRKALKIGASRGLLWMYDRFQRMRGGIPYPYRSGELKKTPTEELNLKVGELIQVKSYQEILATLDQNNRNRGLYFDAEMVPYCNGKHRVLSKVDHIVNEKNGEMSKLPGACIMLEGVTCRSLYSDRRIGCPRSIYSYWREIWLKRVDEATKD